MKLSQIIHNPWVQRSIAFGIFLVIWQIVGETVSPIALTTPVHVAIRFGQLTANGSLPRETLITVQTMLIGFAISALIGIPFGLLMGRSRIFEYSIDPYINLLYATPTVAILPLIVIWFGSSIQSSYLIVVLHAFIPITITVYAGVKNTSKNLLETGRSFSFAGVSLWRKVVFPATVPYIMTGLRIGVAISLIGALVAEIFMYDVGLGYVLVYYAGSFDTAATLCGVLVTIALGLLSTELIKLLERKTTSWGKGAVGIR